MERLLYIEALAETLDKDVAAIRWMRHKGELPPAAMIGGRLAWTESQIAQFIEDAFAKAS